MRHAEGPVMFPLSSTQRTSIPAPFVPASFAPPSFRRKPEPSGVNELGSGFRRNDGGRRICRSPERGLTPFLGVRPLSGYDGKKSRGFTLLEVLVALTITGLAL